MATSMKFASGMLAGAALMISGACGLLYQAPSGPSGPYVTVVTSLSTITPFGVSAQPISVQLGINLNQSYSPTIGSRSAYAATTDAAAGTYFMLDPVVPGRWSFFWQTWPCASQADHVDILGHYSTVWLVCTVSQAIGFNYSMDNSGNYVYTGGGDKLVDGWNGTMYADECRTSADGRYDFCYQGDGNLVLYDGGNPLWYSGTNGTSAGRTVMQDDGNLVVYDGGNVPQWYTGTSGQPGNFAIVQSNRCVLMYTPDGTYIPWGTSTCVSPGSNQVQQPPLEPLGLGASVSGSTVHVWWAAPPGPVADYVLEAGTSPGMANVGTYYLNSTPSTTFYGVGPGTYYVRVRARNNGGTSPPSAEFTIVV